MRFIPGPDLPTGGKIVGLDGIRDAYATGNGSFRMRATARIDNVTAAPKRHRRHRAALQRRPRDGHRGDQEAGADQEAAGHLRHQEPDRPAPRASTSSSRSRARSTPRPSSSSSTGSRRWRRRSRSTPSRSSTGSRAHSASRDAHGLPRPPLRRGAATHRRSAGARRRPAAPGRWPAHRARRHRRGHPAHPRQRRPRPGPRTTHRASSTSASLQADYILDLQLGRLTKFSRIELEKEAEQLRADIDELDAILADEALLRSVVATNSTRWPSSSAPRGAPCCWSRPARPSPPRAPLEVADDPCWVLLSATGLLARTADDAAARRVGRRAKHDTIVAAARTTARGQVGLVTSGGRVHRLNVVEIPSIPPTSLAPRTCRAASRCASFAAPRRQRAVLTPDDVRRRRPRHRARHRAGRGQAGQARPPDQPRRAGSSSRWPTATRSSAPLVSPATSSWCSSRPTPSSCASTPPPCGRRAEPAAASPAFGSPTAPASSLSAVRDVDDALS